MKYLPYVDGLRAVAIAAVVGFHAFPDALPGGFVGVDVFFVISGFLITRFIASEIETGTFSFPRFLLRRARRLLPAAAVCFAAVAILSALILLPDGFSQFGRSLMAAVLMYANFSFYHAAGYFSAPAHEKPLLHTWSLSVEDQFYLTWPLILIAALPFARGRGTAALAGVLLAVSLAFAQKKVGADPDYAFYMMPTRAWELMTGAIVALAGRNLKLSNPLAETLASTGLLLVLASMAMLSGASEFPGLSAVPACLGTAFIIQSGLSSHTMVTRFLALKPVVFLGLISYSLYLWHWPLISLTSYRLERPLANAEALTVITLSLVLAVLSWRFVERPFRVHAGERAPLGFPAADRRFALGSVTAAALLAALGGVIKAGSGFPQRFDAKVRPILEQLVAGNPLRPACDNYDKIFINDGVCNFGRKRASGDSYEVALFGDSMADHWTPMVAQFAAANNLAGRQVTNGGCLLLFGTPVPVSLSSKLAECTAYEKEAGRFISANPGLKLAVISAYWEKWLFRLEHTGKSGEPLPGAEVTAASADFSAPAFEQAIAKTLKAFTSRGIRVLLIGQIPTYLEVPVRCIVSSVRAGGDASECGKTAVAARAELSRSDLALKRVASADPLVSVALPGEIMCGASVCPPMMSGTLLYKNGGHVNSFGALEIGKHVTFPPLQEMRGAAQP